MTDDKKPATTTRSPERTRNESIVIERTYRASVQELWSLWTTKDGFESWWGPQGFRVEVHAMDARPGGELHYDMIADTSDTIAAMKQLGRPASHETRGTFSELSPFDRLTLTHIIDFLPGVKPYASRIEVEFRPSGEQVRMVVTLGAMHDAEFTKMQLEGFTSQLGKLDQRYGWKA
jgi:uncharacterized protein YndB with AHSA1/START domain